MADLNEAEAAKKLEEPASKQCEMLEGNKAREEAVQELEEEKEKELPKLSAAEFRAYNSMAENMDYYHNHFRQTWTMLYNSCINNKRPQGISLKQFITMGLQFCSQLNAHHSIEEAHVFPMLARKMPEFKQGKNAAELLRQHKQIHDGMDTFVEYLQKCRSGEIELELRVVKEKMDLWGDILWKHLDQEVKTLGAENMRKYWTIQEIKNMPM